MGIEDDIRSYLASGYNPQQIIRQFSCKKSTVYKVYNEQKMSTTLVASASWSVQEISFDKGIGGRYLPGETATIRFNLVNEAPSDLYVSRTGIQPEWMEVHLGVGCSQWLSQDNTFLLRPNETRPFRFSMEVPSDLILGEYDIRFGMEGQFMSPPSAYSNRSYSSPHYTDWTAPVVFRVQHPVTHTIFVSHSTENTFLVRQLDSSLENYGVHCIVAEDIKEPGQNLRKKFHHYIDVSNFFLGLLTKEAVMSPIVIDEVDYAIETNKPGIYLVEKGTNLQLPVEWASQFSRNWPIDKLVTVVLEAMENIQNRGGYQTNNFPVGQVVAALAAFFIGLGAGRSDKGSKT